MWKMPVSIRKMSSLISEASSSLEEDPISFERCPVWYEKGPIWLESVFGLRYVQSDAKMDHMPQALFIGDVQAIGKYVSFCKVLEPTDPGPLKLHYGNAQILKVIPSKHRTYKIMPKLLQCQGSRHQIPRLQSTTLDFLCIFDVSKLLPCVDVRFLSEKSRH